MAASSTFMAAKKMNTNYHRGESGARWNGAYGNSLETRWGLPWVDKKSTNEVGVIRNDGGEEWKKERAEPSTIVSARRRKEGRKVSGRRGKTGGTEGLVWGCLCNVSGIWSRRSEEKSSRPPLRPIDVVFAPLTDFFPSLFSSHCPLFFVVKFTAKVDPHW